MLELYLLRHGQTEYNKRNIVQGGGIDSELNEEGLRQAQLFFTHYQHIPFRAVVHTSLRRTAQTVAPFRSKGIPFHALPELDELNWGIIEGREASDEVVAHFQNVTSAWMAGQLDAKIEGGESALECWQRVEAGIQKLKHQFSTGGKVLVCTHGRTLRVLLAGLTGYGLQRMHIFPHDNTALNILHLSPGGKTVLHRLNDTTHLQA